MALQTNRAGFALPMAMLLIGFMTAGVLAGFARSSAEVHVADNQSAESAAFAFAEAGLAQYLGAGQVAAPQQAFTYTNGPVPVGQATVTATLMFGAAGSDGAVYLIQSVGTAVGPAGKPQASRTVAQFATRRLASMQVLSSWTSLSGLNKAGVSGKISGFDATGCAATGNVAGVAVPTGLLTGQDASIMGEPQYDYMGTVAEMAAGIEIDWVNIAKPVAPSIIPDQVVCMPGTVSFNSQYTNCGSWPSSSKFTDPNYWPTIVINGSSPLPSNGRGVLIVTGDLTFGGGDQWDGIILVGGRITDNGSGNIAGAVVSGLNVLKGETVGASSKANGTKDYVYDSCAVQAATESLARLNQITNAWADNLATW